MRPFFWQLTSALFELHDTFLWQKIQADHVLAACTLSALLFECREELLNELHLELPPLLIVLVFYLCSDTLAAFLIKEVLERPREMIISLRQLPWLELVRIDVEHLTDAQELLI
jgi:hypothetical protein